MRICIEIDLSKGLLDRILIKRNGITFFQLVDYIVGLVNNQTISRILSLFLKANLNSLKQKQRINDGKTQKDLRTL